MVDINAILNQVAAKEEPAKEEGLNEVKPSAQGDLLDLKFSKENLEITRKKLIDFRRRVASGEAIPPEELADALLLLREMYGREAEKKKVEKAKESAAAKKKPVARKPKPTPTEAAKRKAAIQSLDPNELLNSLLGKK